MFLGSNFSMGAVTLSDETGSQKSKMAAGTNVISRISANIHDNNEFPFDLRRTPDIAQCCN
jgi:hypothetical protein